jgi:predicted N-acetyltransferase YhbS
VVDAVTRAAFGRELEPVLLTRLREAEGWMPELSLVAVEAGEVSGTSSARAALSTLRRPSDSGPSASVLTARVAASATR